MPSNHPLLSPSPPAFNRSQHQGLFQWVSSSHQVTKVLEFSISPSNEYSELISCRIDWFDLFADQGTLKSLLQNHSSKLSVLQHSAFSMAQPSHLYTAPGKTISFDYLDLCWQTAISIRVTKSAVRTQVKSTGSSCPIPPTKARLTWGGRGAVLRFPAFPTHSPSPGWQGAGVGVPERKQHFYRNAPCGWSIPLPPVSWGLPWAAPDHGLPTCAWGGLHTGGRARAGQRASTNSVNSHVNVTVSQSRLREAQKADVISQWDAGLAPSWGPAGRHGHPPQQALRATGLHSKLLLLLSCSLTQHQKLLPLNWSFMVSVIHTLYSYLSYQLLIRFIPYHSIWFYNHLNILKSNSFHNSQKQSWFWSAET